MEFLVPIDLVPELDSVQFLHKWVLCACGRVTRLFAHVGVLFGAILFYFTEKKMFQTR